ncbi:MAG: methyltransferase [Desulfobulbaceae bacterium]|nr:methyltransferase [Desulfobulbaceae bacterium]
MGLTDTGSGGDAGISEEYLFDGRLVCRQHRNGYRFSVDAVLLAHFVTIREQDRIVDLGGGCGIVSLAIAYRHPTVTLAAVEIQPQLVDLCCDNVMRNGLAERIEVRAADYRLVQGAIERNGFDVVVANPPFRATGAGRRIAVNERTIARQELQGGLVDAARAACWALRERGRAAFVYPAERTATLLSVLREHRLEPKRLRVVYGYPGGRAKLVLAEAVKFGGEGMEILPPCCIQVEQGGEYSEELRGIYGPTDR